MVLRTCASIPNTCNNYNRVLLPRNFRTIYPYPCHFSRGVSTSRHRQGSRMRCSIAPRASANVDAEVEYNDSWTDIAFIALCRQAYGNIAGWQSQRDWKDGKETYAGMVEVSRALMKGRTADQQRNAVIAGFPEVPAWFRKVFPYSKWGAELNAKITPAFFTWLVGPMETVEAEVNGEKQKSAVHIKKCRYLAESGCVGMCVNLCKSPVQLFFTEQLGMPLTMSPNFEAGVEALMGLDYVSAKK